MLTLSPHRGQRVEKWGIGSAIVDRLPVASALPGRVFPENKGPVHRRPGQLLHGNGPIGEWKSVALIARRRRLECRLGVFFLRHTEPANRRRPLDVRGGRAGNRTRDNLIKSYMLFYNRR